MKMLKVCWYQQDVNKELKVYEKLALQYFYKQDIESCKKYLDRSLRGKFEGPNSSSKRVAMQQGIRTDDDEMMWKSKRQYAGAAVQRTSISKVSDSIVRDYKEIFFGIQEARSGCEFRPAVSQMVEEIFASPFCNKTVRPGTPLSTIPDHKLLKPSEAGADHMLLPTLSVQDLKNITRIANNGIADFRTKLQHIDEMKYQRSLNMARVQLNQQRL